MDYSTGPANDRSGGGPVARAARGACAALVRRYGDFDHAEDAVQEALLDAATQWRESGLPANPRAVGWSRWPGRRLIEIWRSEASRRRRAARGGRRRRSRSRPDATGRGRRLARGSLLLCCHPALTPPVAGGVDVAGRRRSRHRRDRAPYPRPRGHDRAADQPGEEATIARSGGAVRAAGRRRAGGPDRDGGRGRLSRLHRGAHRQLRRGGRGRADRCAARGDPSCRAGCSRIGRCRSPAGRVPGGSSTGCWRCCCSNRRAGGAEPGGGTGGTLIPLAEQDRATWDRQRIGRRGGPGGTAALRGSPLGPYQLQAAIAAGACRRLPAPADRLAQLRFALCDLLWRSPPVR